MWGAIIGALLFGRSSRRGPVVPDAPKPVPRPREQEAGKRAFEGWAKKNGLRRDDAVCGYRGHVGGRLLVVRPGLDGSSPVGAEAEVSIDHGEPAVFLLTPRRRSGPAAPGAANEIAEALARLFDDGGLGALRSIAVIKEGLRLGFVPLTGPDDVQAAVDAAVSAVDELLRLRPRPNAYR